MNACGPGETCGQVSLVPNAGGLLDTPPTQPFDPAVVRSVGRKEAASAADCTAVRGTVFTAGFGLFDVCATPSTNTRSTEDCGDGVGNDNGLCEAGEVCVMAFGANASQIEHTLTTALDLGVFGFQVPNVGAATP